jgi:hypothetical protein
MSSKPLFKGALSCRHAGIVRDVRRCQYVVVVARSMRRPMSSEQLVSFLYLPPDDMHGLSVKAPKDARTLDTSYFTPNLA